MQVTADRSQASGALFPVDVCNVSRKREGDLRSYTSRGRRTTRECGIIEKRRVAVQKALAVDAGTSLVLRAESNEMTGSMRKGGRSRMSGREV